jgi:uncharacterized protein YbaR (Trm112 family)
MHILLTDALRCPRCGPEFGLILLADRMDDRRVLEGRLGCANCREAYPIRGGGLDLRVPGGERLPEAGDSGADTEAALRLAALLGLSEPRGSVLLVGAGAELAGEVAALVPGAEVVDLSGAPAEGEERPGVNRVAAGMPFPFASGSLGGVALTGRPDPVLVDEGARVVAPGGRMVVEGAPEGAAGLLQGRGLRLLLEQEGTLVAERPGGRFHSPPGGA